jgi:dynactin complex subunit
MKFLFHLIQKNTDSFLWNCRYCGTVDFASGVWVGVELDTPEGKNDGIIQDTIYFKCSPNHGINR